MKVASYSLIWGIALAALTWLILFLVPEQLALQSTTKLSPVSSVTDSTIQVVGGPLIEKPDVVSINTDTTALMKRVRIDTAHVYIKPVPVDYSTHGPLMADAHKEERYTEYTNIKIAKRAPGWTNHEAVALKHFWRFDSLTTPISATTTPITTPTPSTITTLTITTPTTTTPVSPVTQPRKQMHIGQLVFDWPGQMAVNLTYQIHLVIAWDTTRRYLVAQVDSLVQSGVDTAGQHRKDEVKSIEIGNQMRAVLVGASATDTSVTIMPLGDTEHNIDFTGSKTAKWSWDVTPRRSGSIVLSVYFERETPLPPIFVYSKNIIIQGVKTSNWDKFMMFLTNLNKLWTSLSTGAVGAIATGLYKYWQTRKKDNDTTGSH